MVYFDTVSTLVSTHSQFLLLLVVTYCVLKVIHLEKDVRYLQYDMVCVRESVEEMQNENEETDDDVEDVEDMKDEDYEPEDTTSEEGAEM